MPDPAEVGVLSWEDFARAAADSLGVDPAECRPETRLVEDLGLDSMGSLHLQVAIYDLAGVIASLDALGEIATLGEAHGLYLTLRTGGRAPA